MTELRLTEVRFTPAPVSWQDEALLGWASCVVDDAMGVGGLGVRRTRKGEVTLSFPGRKDSDSDVQDHVWFREDGARRAFETQVLGEPRRQGKIP